MAGKKRSSRKALPHDPFEDMGTMDWLDPASEDATQADAVGTAALSTDDGNSGADPTAAGATTPKSKAEGETAAAGATIPVSQSESAAEAKAIESSGNDKKATRSKKGRPTSKKRTAAKRSAKPKESKAIPEDATEAIPDVTEAATASTQDDSADAAQTKELKRSEIDRAESRSKKRKPNTKKRSPVKDVQKPKETPVSSEVPEATTSGLAEAGAVEPRIEELEPSTESIDPYLENLIATIDGEMEATFGLDPMVEESPGETEDTIAEQHIIFELAGTEYSVYINNVIEIGPPLHVTPVPNVPAWVQGVVNLRGDIVSVVDLRSFLGMPAMSYRQSSRMLVARTHQEDLTVGLIVDRVSGIRYLDVDHFGAPTADIEDQIAPYLRGTYEHEGHLLVVLDLDRLLRSTEMRQFETV